MQSLKLNIGCGKEPLEGWLNLDSRSLPGVDIVRDVLRGLPFGDCSLEAIRSENLLEHLPQPEVIWFINECWRVLKPDGVAEHFVPIAGGPADVDPTHLSRWYPETFTYFEWAHARNSYYEGIKPWVIKLEVLQPNQVMRVEMRPYYPALPD